MPQAAQMNSTPHTHESALSALRSIHEALSELELPLHEIRRLATAIDLMSVASSVDPAAREAFEIIAECITSKIDAVIEARESLWDASRTQVA
jgi:hypothetical protein